MPYSGPDDPGVPDWVKKSGKADQWVSVFNQVYEQTNDEQEAFSAAASAIVGTQDAAPAQDAPPGKAPAQGAPARQAPAQGAPARQAPAQGAPARQAPPSNAAPQHAAPGKAPGGKGGPDPKSSKPERPEGVSPQKADQPENAHQVAPSMRPNGPEPTGGPKAGNAQQVQPSMRGETDELVQGTPDVGDPNEGQEGPEPQPYKEPDPNPEMVEPPLPGLDEDVSEEELLARLRRKIMKTKQQATAEGQPGDPNLQQMAAAGAGARPQPAKQMMHSESGEYTLFREAMPETFSGDKARVQAFKTGKWNHPVYGEFEVKVPDLQNMVRNFNATKRAVVVDYDHGTDLGKTPEERKAAGWMRKLEVEEKEDGSGVLWADFELTSKAAEYVKNGEYRFFSPTWTQDYSDKESGQDLGPTLLRGALTNSPFIDGMHPAVALSERAAAAMEAVSAKAVADVEAQFRDARAGRAAAPASGGGRTAAVGAGGSAGTIKAETGAAGAAKPAGATGGIKVSYEVKMGDVMIAAERVGMPMGASAEQVRDGVYHLYDQFVEATETVRRLSEELAKYKGAARQLREMEVNLLVKDAIHDQKIEPADSEFVKTSYMKDPVGTKRWLDAKPAKRYLAAEYGIRDEYDAPPNAMAEIESRAREKMARDPKLTLGKAQSLVLNEDPNLQARYRNATTLGADGLGGSL